MDPKYANQLCVIGVLHKFSFPKQAQKSRSVLYDRSKILGLFWKGKHWSYNRRKMVWIGKYVINHITHAHVRNYKAGSIPQCPDVSEILLCPVLLRGW